MARREGALGPPGMCLRTHTEMPSLITIPLNISADTVLDVDCRSGALLREWLTPSKTFRLLGVSPKQESESSDYETLITSMGEATDLLKRANAMFDLVVCAPRVGKVPSKGVPIPRKKEATGRRILTGDAGGSPEIDNGYAAWCCANALLSPFGEGVVLVVTDTLALIEACPLASRIWLKSPVTEKLTAVYFAADHKQDPASPPEVAFYNSESLASAFSNRRKYIRGQTISAHDRTPDSAQRFGAVRRELRRRLHGDSGWNVTFNAANEVSVSFSDFQRYAKELPQEILDCEENFNGRRMLDIAILADSRGKFSSLLAERGVSFAPQVALVWKETLRQVQTLRSPLVRPSPVQRIAWLDEQAEITCKIDVEAPSELSSKWEQPVVKEFERGKKYPIRSLIFDGRKLEMRHRPGFGPEEVLVTGQELMLCIDDGEGRAHAFTQFPLTATQIAEEFPAIHRFHRLQTLIHHFELPDVPDIAESDPQLYQTYVDRLHALETP